MYDVGSLYVGCAVISYTPPVPGVTDYYYPWNIKYYHKSGGLKKDWVYGQSDCPITNFNFELNLKGCGFAEINLAYIDFPIDAFDFIDVYYEGTKLYHGFVERTPDPKGGRIEILPRSTRFSELLYDGAFSSTAFDTILQTVVEAVEADSEIDYNALYIDTGSSDTYTIEYVYEKVDKIINDLIARLNDRYWGVNENNIFYVEEYGSSVASTVFYLDNPYYSGIDIEYDYSGIQATRFQVYKKTAGSGDTSYIGQVGYGGSYPVLAVETLFRKIEDTITISEVLGSTEALDYAYAKLQTYNLNRTITINNCQKEYFDPTIGSLINVQDSEETILTTVIDCESTTGWSAAAALDTSNYVEGAASIYFDATAVDDYIEYNFGKQKRYLMPEKIGFMIWCEEAGRKLYIKITYGTNYNNYGYGSGYYSEGAYSAGDTDGDETTETYTENSIYIAAAEVWYYRDYEMSLPIASIRWYWSEAPTGTVQTNIDRVQILRPFRNQYEANVVQKNYDVSQSGTNLTVKLDSYDPKLNDTFFELEKKVNILESALVSS